MEMMETRVTKEKPPVVYDLDDYRRGLRDRPNDVEVAITPEHKVNLWTIQAGQTVPMHSHANSECVIITMAGQGEYRQGDGSYDIKKGTMTVAPPGEAHGFWNNNSEPLVLLTIEGPGPLGTRVLERGSDEKFY